MSEDNILFQWQNHFQVFITLSCQILVTRNKQTSQNNTSNVSLFLRNQVILHLDMLNVAQAF